MAKRAPARAPAVAAPPAPPPIPPATPLSNLYQRWTLDCVIDAAQVIAQDYVKRPRQYRDRPADPVPAQVLSEFRFLIGSNPNWPSPAQRAASYSAIFGASDAKPGTDSAAQFQRLASAVRAAAAAYSRRVYDTGEPMLRQAFVNACVALQAYLTSLQGGALATLNAQTAAISNGATTLLTSVPVAAAFGLPPAPGAPWPFDGAYNGDGAYLLEEILRIQQPPIVPPMTMQRFIALQQIAQEGARTLAAIQNADHLTGMAPGGGPHPRLEQLIGFAYSWATAIEAISS